jgi:hypothetical protein
MFNDLQNLLNYEAIKPTFTLIESRNNNNDGLFLINHLLSNIVKNETKTCLITLQQTISHYKSIQTKIGNLNKFSKLIENGVLAHVDGLKELSTDPNEDLFSTFFNSIYSRLNTDLANVKYLIIDDLSIFYLLGCSLNGLYEFLFKLKNTYHSLSLIVYAKNLSDSDWDNLIKDFAYLSELYLIVSDLTTGYSKDIHGQVSTFLIFILPENIINARCVEFLVWVLIRWVIQ